MMVVRSESYKHSLIGNCSKIERLSLSLDFWKYNDYNIVFVLIRFWKDEVLTNKIISIESLVDTKAQTFFDHIKTRLIAFQIDYNKILTTCTDNCNGMLSFGSLFETQKRSEIVFDLLEEECDEVIKTLEICLKNSTHVGYFVHLLQTAMKNSISQIEEVTEFIYNPIDCAKEINKNLKEEHLPKIKLPFVIRWNTYILFMGCILKNYSAYEEKFKIIKNLRDNVTFPDHQTIKKYYSILYPILLILKNMKNECFIGKSPISKNLQNLRSRKRQNNYEIYFYTEKRNINRVCQI